jgi:glycosyltransferase involved in cell wall biosynthesis
MRVLFLTKQQYMGKDLLHDRFGRFYEFPRSLADRGHDVCGVCLKYWTDEDRLSARRQCLDGVEWMSFQLGWNWPVAFLRHFRRLNELATEFEPDIVVGASDAAHVIMAASLSTRLGVPLALDLYDDFESYWATQLPGIKRGLKRGILKAAVISTVSQNLAAKVEQAYQAPGIVSTITNAVCPEIFHPGDKISARRKLGLPESGLLIGTAGALSSNRGIDLLISAFEKMCGDKSDSYLILAGPVGHDLRLPKNDGIRYLGELPHADVGYLFNALDVGVVCNRRNQFAEYCFPQKFYEMIACRLPVVAADVGVMRGLFFGYEDCLYDPEQAESLADTITKQLSARRIAEHEVPSWKNRGDDFNDLLEQALAGARANRHKASGEGRLQQNHM